MPFNIDKIQPDLQNGARDRAIIRANADDIAHDQRAPAFMVTQTGNYTIKLHHEPDPAATPLIQGVVYNIWLAAFTAGPSAAARIHLLYPEAKA